MSSTTQERAVLEQVLANFRSEGYDVFAEPSDLQLPLLLKGMSPDGIAIRQDQKIVIEVTREDPRSAQRLAKIQKQLASQNEWQLRVFSITDVVSSKKLPAISDEIIGNSIKDVEKLIAANQLQAALLLAWATLEGIGRALLPDNLGRPQTPARLVEVLASHGFVTPDDADNLRRFALMRNKIVHGELSLSLEPADIGKIVLVLKLASHELDR